ncbi:MAG: hypothetical protein A2Y24_02880 [Clostridiales bacterium GWE2_32_10]|nr:MAG: hypothetical protein A2Y24_02880 [Clostridiales bacterium GWE2_32_10]HBY19559.1 hypothetical protein [Clostridiales bacterium]
MGWCRYLVVIALIMIVNMSVSNADVGEMGFFCGVSEGVKLPKVMDDYVSSVVQTNNKKELRYKEVVFLTGKPQIFEGLLTFSKTGDVDPNLDSGTYTVTYSVTPYKDPITQDTLIKRVVTFNVNYRKVDNQILKNYELKSWKETITIGEVLYTLDSTNSVFNNTFIEYNAPGIKYYKGSIGYRAIYKNDDQVITVNVVGDNAIYGYDQVWGKTETQLLKVVVDSVAGSDQNTWRLEAEVKPSISVNKTMQYDSNKPNAIGFGGNYLQVTQNESGIAYKVTTEPTNMDYKDVEGTVSIPSYNTFEHLVAPLNTDYLEGSFAEEDIKKLYSLEILDSTFEFIPNEKLTRAQYVTLLVKTLGLDKKYKEPKGYKPVATFGDVDIYHPHFRNIEIASEVGLVKGTNKGNFQPDNPVKREEAFLIYMRALGLSRLGQDITPVTPFMDDDLIAPWAKKDIYGLYNLGLIKGDVTGNLRPKDEITKAEGAAIINRLINYLRKDIENDYVEKLIEY